ncbi:MAG TPA: hypothetical protein VFO66_07045 [Gemmatimonadaceae bacterium]|nr:hypothetical protein [Gemmatimonadaceae bacterium]
MHVPGLTGESYYRTRRSELTATLVVTGGVAAALYTGATRLMKLVGIPSLGPELGMSDYMVDVILGAASGAIAGALAAWVLGALWERWHRRRRTRRELRDGT